MRFTTRLGERIVKTVKREGILQSGKKKTSEPPSQRLPGTKTMETGTVGQSELSMIDGHSSRRSSQVAGQDPIPNIPFQSLNQVSFAEVVAHAWMPHGKVRYVCNLTITCMGYPTPPPTHTHTKPHIL